MKYLMLLGLMFSVWAQAGDNSKAEINHLFTYLENSGCEFNRNGSWYNAKEASAHLRKKYGYLEEKKLVKSAEDFIERAATKSSVSGKAYQVRCVGAAPVESAGWFTAELVRYRRQ
jgi:hypothetical protein